jgi:ABC-2 type transport system ATP-binding protein
MRLLARSTRRTSSVLPDRSAETHSATLRAVETSGSASRSSAIHTVGLRKQFRATVALRGLSMTVERGEVFGFLGPNGAGKTTAVKLLLGLVRPTGGEAMVLGAPAGDLETRRRIGYLPELFRYQGWLTAEEVLGYHCRFLQLERPSRPGAVREVLSVVGLSGRGRDKVSAFSKGMQQRLGLGVALLGSPELIVLDEPTSALDPVGRHDVREIIRALREQGTTVFLNTHLLDEAEQVCDRVAVVDRGETVATGSLAELLGGHATVRLRVDGLDGEWWRDLPGPGLARREGEWVVVRGVPSGGVPDLVRHVVDSGGFVQAVVPEQESLEERFLEILKEHE